MLFCSVVDDGSRVGLLCGHIAVFPSVLCEVLLYVFEIVLMVCLYLVFMRYVGSAYFRIAGVVGVYLLVYQQ